MGALTWSEPKDPDEIEDFSVNWAGRLDEGDTVATSIWDVPVGLTMESNGFTASTTTIWLSGGTAGQSYEFNNRVVTTGGRTFDQEIWLRVDKDEEFISYATVEDADAYMDGAIHGSVWEDEDYTTKYKALVSATRMLDRQLWLGSKTDSAQLNQWPRTGTGVDGVEDDAVPTDITSATIELALAFIGGSDVQNQQSTAERVRSMSAGSVSITNFRGVDTVASRFPQIVQELVAKYLGGSSSSFAAKATGVDTETIFPVELGFGTGGM